MNAKIFNRLVDKVKRGGASVCVSAELYEPQVEFENEIEVSGDVWINVTGTADLHTEFEDGQGYSPSYSYNEVDCVDVSNVFAFNPNDISDDTEDLTDEQQRELVEVLNEYLIVEL